MTHSVVGVQAMVRWLLHNNIIPKAIPLSEYLAQCPHLIAHINTKKLVKLARTHWLWYTQDCSSHMRDGCIGWHWQLLMTTLWHSLPHHPSIKPTLFHSLSTLTQHALAWGHSVIVPTSLFWDCVDGTLPAGSLNDSLPQTHKMVENQNKSQVLHIGKRIKSSFFFLFNLHKNTLSRNLYDVHIQFSTPFQKQQTSFDWKNRIVLPFTGFLKIYKRVCHIWLASVGSIFPEFHIRLKID